MLAGEMARAPAELQACEASMSVAAMYSQPARGEYSPSGGAGYVLPEGGEQNTEAGPSGNDPLQARALSIFCVSLKTRFMP